MDQHGQQLTETYLSMLNTHDPDLVDRFVADGYRNHNAFVADGREANRQFWTVFFAALPDLKVTMEDLRPPHPRRDRCRGCIGLWRTG